jgi:hypothetical protein
VGLATVEVEVEIEQQSEQKMLLDATLSGIKEGKVKIKSCEKTPFWIYFKQLL